MFEKLKKNKTVRSLLTAAAVFSAGAPAVAGTPSKPATKTVQTAPNPARGRLDLIQMYRPVCAALEKDLCYCYDDKGVPACGSGVRFCYYPELKDVEGIKLTIRRGCVLDLTDTAYLKQMADANWKHPKTAPLFPVVLKAEKVKLKDVTGGMPTGSQKKLVGGELVVIPSGTLAVINTATMDSNVRKALAIHPNLFQLPPLAQCVVVDLIYNLGDVKYKEKFPKFQAAVNAGDLAGMYRECSVKNNARRNAVRKSLLLTEILMRDNPTLSQDKCTALFHSFLAKENPNLTSRKEPELLRVLDATVRGGWNRRSHSVKRSVVTMTKGPEK